MHFGKQEKANKNELAMFRTGSKKRWEKQIKKEGLLSLVRFYLYYIVNMAIALGFCFCFCKGNNEVYIKELFEFYGVSNISIYQIAIRSILLKGVELIFLYEISLFFYRYTKQTLVSFLAAMSISVLGFWEMFSVVRIGKSCAYQLFEEIQTKGAAATWNIFLQIGIIVILFMSNHMGGKENEDGN